MFAIAVFLSVFSIFQDNGQLSGKYETVASVTDVKTELSSPKSMWQFEFDKDAITWVNRDPDYLGIPLSGTKLNLKYDVKASPKRIEIWFDEGGAKEIFAYGIFKQEGDNLLIKLLFPLALGSNGTPKDLERFRKSPYPIDFSPPEAQKFESLLVMKKTPAVSKKVTSSEQHLPENNK